MITIVLLAGSFVRQNRWLLLAFAAWPFLLAAFFWSPHHHAERRDVIDLLQQEVFYGIGVTGFLASSALHNEKRSRRIIGVLSKAVSRAQYLLGLLTGAGLFAIVYFMAVAGSTLWLLGDAEPIAKATLAIVLHGVSASLWIGSLALLFSTFLHPLIAAAIAGAMGFVPFAFSHVNSVLAPIVSLYGASDLLAPHLAWRLMLIVLMETLMFLIVSARVFGRRDVTQNVE